MTLGKTFKGLTERTLAWQTAELLARETGRDARTVPVRPELVVEVAFDGLQRGPRYPAGLALRFTPGGALPAGQERRRGRHGGLRTGVGHRRRLL